MREREPATEVLCGFVRRFAIERHQGCRSAWLAGDLRTPLAKADARYLNLVGSAVDDLLKTMHDAAPRRVIENVRGETTSDSSES